MKTTASVREACCAASIVLTVALTALAQQAPAPACKPGTLADYSEIHCTVNNLDFTFDKVNFRTPDPKTVQVMPVSDPDGLRFLLPEIKESPDDFVQPEFITFNPSFVYRVKALKDAIGAVILEGVTPPRNPSAGEPSRNATLLFGPGMEPKQLLALRLVVFDAVKAEFSRPVNVGQVIKAGEEMVFVDEKGTPAFPFTNRFPSKK
jgi:hypothetical protein